MYTLVRGEDVTLFDPLSTFVSLLLLMSPFTNYLTSCPPPGVLRRRLLSCPMFSYLRRLRVGDSVQRSVDLERCRPLSDTPRRRSFNWVGDRPLGTDEKILQVRESVSGCLSNKRVTRPSPSVSRVLQGLVPLCHIGPLRFGRLNTKSGTQVAGRTQGPTVSRG